MMGDSESLIAEIARVRLPTILFQNHMNPSGLIAFRLQLGCWSGDRRRSNSREESPGFTGQGGR